MSIFDKAYKVSIPEEMVDIDNWITDEDIVKYFIEFPKEIGKEDTKNEDSQSR